MPCTDFNCSPVATAKVVPDAGLNSKVSKPTNHDNPSSVPNFMYNVPIPSQLCIELKQEAHSNIPGLNPVNEVLTHQSPGEQKQEFPECSGEDNIIFLETVNFLNDLNAYRATYLKAVLQSNIVIHK